MGVEKLRVGPFCYNIMAKDYVSQSDGKHHISLECYLMKVDPEAKEVDSPCGDDDGVVNSSQIRACEV